MPSECSTTMSSAFIGGLKKSALLLSHTPQFLIVPTLSNVPVSYGSYSESQMLDLFFRVYSVPL